MRMFTQISHGPMTSRLVSSPQSRACSPSTTNRSMWCSTGDASIDPRLISSTRLSRQPTGGRRRIALLGRLHESWFSVPVEDRSVLDEVSKAWVVGLMASGRAHEDCVSALYQLLLKVARHEVGRRAGTLQLRGPELDDIAQQATDDALMAIRSKVAGFRGDSRFTTWAYRFVMFEVSTKMGRHFWRDHRTGLDDDAWAKLPDLKASSPDRQAVQTEMFVELRRAVDEDLTELQRRVFVAIALNEVPMDAFARELGSSRNAVYKTLFDARRKLRASLAEAGYHPPFATAVSR